MTPPVAAALITGGIAFLVGTAGVIGTVMVARYANRRQVWSGHQDRTYEDRRLVYATVLRFADNYHDVLETAMKDGGREQQLLKVLTEFQQADEIAQLIAPDNVLDLLEGLRKAINNNQDIPAARERFYSAAREDLRTINPNPAGA